MTDRLLTRVVLAALVAVVRRAGGVLRSLLILVVGVAACAPGYVRCPVSPVARPSQIERMAQDIEQRNITLDLGGEGEHEMRVLVAVLEEHRAMFQRCEGR